jgi:hypothetical protein
LGIILVFHLAGMGEDRFDLLLNHRGDVPNDSPFIAPKGPPQAVSPEGCLPRLHFPESLKAQTHTPLMSPMTLVRPGDKDLFRGEESQYFFQLFFYLVSPVI